MPRFLDSLEKARHLVGVYFTRSSTRTGIVREVFFA